MPSNKQAPSCSVFRGLAFSCFVSEDHKSRDGFTEPCGLRAWHIAVVPGETGEKWTVSTLFQSLVRDLHIDCMLDATPVSIETAFPSVLRTMKRVIIWRTRHGGKYFYSKCREASLGYRL